VANDSASVTAAGKQADCLLVTNLCLQLSIIEKLTLKVLGQILEYTELKQ